MVLQRLTKSCWHDTRPQSRASNQKQPTSTLTTKSQAVERDQQRSILESVVDGCLQN
jgi:hypothetical protein